jgi:hypothetical protein
MRPYSEIHIGDIYSRPNGTIDWVVVNKNDNEKMIELECSYSNPSFPKTVWKRNSDSLFAYRVFEGKELSSFPDSITTKG